MNPTHTLPEDAIVDFLQQTGPCYLDDLTQQLSDYSWNELFVTLDRMSRSGRVALHRYPKSGYFVSLPSQTQRPSHYPTAEVPS
ncbi:hypothetical protein [Petrachloros mirabilis]